jgi:hypothetical protein
MSKGLNNFLILVKREREEFARIGIFLLIFSFFAFYSLRLLNFPIIFAATPTPSPPSVSNSPEPQKGGGTITFSSNAQPGASGELIKLLICKLNSNLCVLGSQWGYRRQITISSSNTLTNYQVLITLDTSTLISAGKMRTDCGDIRFTDTNGVFLSYWIESGCNSANTKIWVKVPNIPTTIYLYYGNPNAGSLSNGDDTFDYFDLGNKFTTWTQGTYSCSQDTSIGNPSPSYKCPSGSGYYMYKNINLIPGTIITFNVMSNGLGNFYFLVNSAGTGQMYRLDTRLGTYSGFATTSSWTSWNAPSSGFTAAGSTWYKLTIVITSSTSATLYYSRTTDSSPAGFGTLLGTYTITNNGGYIGLVGDALGTSYSTWWDNIIVRKYTSPEPTINVGNEETLSASDVIYTQSSAVPSNPSATYNCLSCSYSQNTYYGVAYSVNETAWTIFTGARTFTCKMEASQSGSCSCASNTQCYNPCNVNWGSYYDGYCYSNKCYDAIPGSLFGSTQSCLAGTLLNHETSSGRHANVNGRLYYCKGSDNSVSPYPFVFNLSPGSSVGNCKCNQNGSWSCPTGIIPIRGGRIKIV